MDKTVAIYTLRLQNKSIRIKCNNARIYKKGI